MTKYVKKPIPVDAVQWFPGVEHSAIIKHWITDKEFACGIATLENQLLYLTPGSYIVGPGAKKEFWVVDEEVFKATYEEAPC